LELAIDSPPTIEEEPEGDLVQPLDNPATKPAIYVQGMNVLCAPFLYAARSEVEAFALFHYFVTKECPGYVRGAMDGVHKGLRLVDRCLEVVDPKLAAYLFSKGMYAELYAFPSVLTLCACTPPLPEVLHLWDFLFAYGLHLNILCIVAQLNRMRDAILQSERYVKTIEGIIDFVLTRISPNKLLRSFPPLEADKVISLTVSFVRKIPDDLYGDLVDHAK
jgi:cell cycle arrest protein BUB2